MDTSMDVDTSVHLHRCGIEMVQLAWSMASKNMDQSELIDRVRQVVKMMEHCRKNERPAHGN